MSKLIDGHVPVKRQCPYAGRCFTNVQGRCTHQGKHQKIPYLCVKAKEFDQVDQVSKQLGKEGKAVQTRYL